MKINGQKRVDTGKARTNYEHKLPANYRSLLMSANRNKLRNELTIEQFTEIRDKKCCFCGSGRMINVIMKERSDGLNIDNVAPCCISCKSFMGQLSFDAFVLKVNVISGYLAKSGGVSGNSGEQEQLMANWDKDKFNFDEA